MTGILKLNGCAVAEHCFVKGRMCELKTSKRVVNAFAHVLQRSLLLSGLGARLQSSSDQYGFLQKIGIGDERSQSILPRD